MLISLHNHELNCVIMWSMANSLSCRKSRGFKVRLFDCVMLSDEEERRSRDVTEAESDENLFS